MFADTIEFTNVDGFSGRAYISPRTGLFDGRLIDLANVVTCKTVDDARG